MTGRTYTDAEFEAASVRHHTHELEALTREDTEDRADIAVLERRELTTAGDFASAIAQRWQDSVVAIIDVGKLLWRAKATLPHGDFGPMVESNKVPFEMRTAQRLMAIAEHSILSNTTHVSHLPVSYGTLYQLTRAPDENLEAWLEDGTVHPEMERSEVLKLLRQLSRAQTGDPGPIEGRYKVFYADPPWRYSDSGPIGSTDNYGRAERHYPTLSLEELCGEENLPNGSNLAADVRAAAEDSAVLFLWSTAPMNEDALRVIRAWGFDYKTQLIWDKVKHNFGHYVSVRHELLLVSTKGSCTPEVKELHDSVVEIERSGRHSEKPEYFRQLIDRLYPSRNRLELFAREKRRGWNCWGNEWK